MDREGFPRRETEFDRLRKNKEAEGWHFVGREGLTIPKLSTEAKFEEVPFQTEDGIREKYLHLAQQADPSSRFEVDLVLDEHTDKLTSLRKILIEEEFRSVIASLRDADKTYFVFVRKTKI
ncbi:MAG: hypothetical protein WC654_01310 [Patescibacteria group bacterium]